MDHPVVVGFLSEKELVILHLRGRQGLTFAECASRMGTKHYTQIQELYKNTLKKIKTWNEINERDPRFLRVCEQHNYPWRSVARLWSILKKNNVVNRYKRMELDELKQLDGVHDRYSKILYEMGHQK